MWRSPVAHYFGVVGVVSSNLAMPTFNIMTVHTTTINTLTQKQ